MSIRKKERIVELNNRKWKISKFDALTGNYIALKMISRLSGVVAGIAAGELADPIIIGLAITQNLGTLPKQEFLQIQEECISCVKEIQEVNGTAIDVLVRTPEGLWGVPDLEEEPLLILGLVSHVLVFNLMDFFSADALKELGKSFQGLIPLDALTSTNSSMGQ